MATANQLEPHKDEETVCGVGKDVLEFLENRNWKNISKTELKSCYRRFIPDLQKEQTHTSKLIDNGYKLFHSKECSVPAINEGYVGMYIPGMEGSCIIMYPQFSQLTSSQLRQLYYFYTKMKYTNLTCKEAQQYTFLSGLASKDYNAFQDFVKTMWIRYHYPRGSKVPPSVVKYINYWWELKTRFLINLYPPTYKNLGLADIPLVINDPNCNFTIMTLNKIVCSRGGPPRMGIPTYKMRYDLVTDFSELCRIKPLPGQDPAVTADEPVTHPVEPVSVDKVVEECIVEERGNVDVVMSVSAIKTIVDCYSRLKEWILPVQIKQMNIPITNSEGTIVDYIKKNVLIIDKKLPPNSMSLNDINILHGKKTAKWALILKSNPHLLQKHPVNTNPSINETRDLKQYEDGLTDVFESFGINPEPVREPHPNFKCKNSEKNVSPVKPSLKENNDNKQEEGGLPDIFDSLGINPQTNKTPSVNDKSETPTLKTTPEKPILNRGFKRSLNGDVVAEISLTDELKPGTNSTEDSLEEGEIPMSDCQETPRPKCFPPRRRGYSNPCHRYMLWDLRKATILSNGAFSKEENKIFNILVRTRVEGKLFHCLPGAQYSNVEEVCVSSKLEFQPEYGASSLSTSELLREYVDVYMRSTCTTKLVRVRSVGYTQEMMMPEVKTLQEIRDSLLTRGIPINKVFDPLYSVLAKLCKIPEGKYLLRHTPKMESFAQLLVEDVDGGNLNLLSHYQRLQEAENIVPTAEIDTHVLTPLHHRDKVPPATFKPSSDRDQAKFLGKPIQIKTDAKKLKKMRKKMKNRLKKMNQ